MKSKKGFTLIELLAIIVILAIIAVITVPIILNIIENSKRGAVQDSAYGYKDAVSKWYVLKLQDDNNYTLNGSYTISDGKLNNIEIPLSGDKPSGGSLHYTNNRLDGGCLTIGEYKVTFDTGGNVSNTEKGECEGVQTIASCPGCVFAYTTDTWYYTGENQTTLTSSQYKDNYQDVISETGKNYFLGIILDDDMIDRVFSCGIQDGTPFCIEGATDGSLFTDNKTFLTELFGEIDYETHLGCQVDRHDWSCQGTIYADTTEAGSVVVGDSATAGENCFIWKTGSLTCGE